MTGVIASLGPVQFGLLGVACVVAASVGVVLVRDAGPFGSFRAPRIRTEGSANRFVRSVGRPLAAVLLRRDTDLYPRTIRRWLANSGRGPSDTPTAFAENHAGVVVIGLAGFLLLGVLGQWLVGGLIVVIAAALPLLRLRRQVRARHAAIEQDLPAFLELMSILIASGLTFRHALARVAGRQRGALGQELRVVLNQLEFGYAPRGAFDDLVRRASTPTVQRVVATVRQNAELGVPVALALSEIADEVRAEAVVRLKIKAQNAATLAAVVLVFVTVPGVLGLVFGVLLSEVLTTFGGLDL